MATRNNNSNSNNNNNFKKADAFLKQQIIVRNPETNEIVKKIWVNRDVPLYADTKLGKSLIANAENRPDYVYELEGKVHIVEDIQDVEEYEFPTQAVA
jgi:hypothetical protein